MCRGGGLSDEVVFRVVPMEFLVFMVLKMDCYSGCYSAVFFFRWVVRWLLRCFFFFLGGFRRLGPYYSRLQKAQKKSQVVNFFFLFWGLC